MEAKKFYDPEYDRFVTEDVIRQQYNAFASQSWFTKTYEQFKHDNFMNEDMTEIKEEETMTKITFTVDETTYTFNPESGRFSKTVNGKTTRIGKAEYEAAVLSSKEWAAIADPNVSVEEFAEMIHAGLVEDEQAELDKDPCIVEVENDLDKPAVLNEYGCVDCRECNVEHCVHRDCMRRNPRSEGGLGECPRLDNGIAGEAEKIAKEDGIELADAELEVNIRNEQKKPSKPRRSKDIAYEGNGVTLTAKQVDFINHLPDTCFWERGLDSTPWVDVLCDEIGGQFTEKPMTVGAMISTLCEKGLAYRGKDRINGHKATYMGLTELGKKVAGELGLE